MSGFACREASLKKTSALVSADVIRLAMLGMVDGNGHPYSWSAIFNGYDAEAMSACPYPGIPAYLDKEPKSTLRIPGAQVTHIWADNPEDARHVAKASLIPNVVEQPEDVIGRVDAVIVATDKGHEHVARCRAFVEAGLPVFIDKPMVDNEPDLRIFGRWVAEGRPIMSSSCMRYAKEFLPFHLSTRNLGDIRFASMTMPKSLERYGIHAFEGLYPIFGPGFVSSRHLGPGEQNLVLLRHSCGASVLVASISEIVGSFGVLTLAGTLGHAEAFFSDTFYAFKAQLAAFINYLRTGCRPFPYEETAELMQIVVAAIRSLEQGGREVMLDEIKTA